MSGPELLQVAETHLRAAGVVPVVRPCTPDHLHDTLTAALPATQLQVESREKSVKVSWSFGSAPEINEVGSVVYTYRHFPPAEKVWLRSAGALRQLLETLIHRSAENALALAAGADLHSSR